MKRARRPSRKLLTLAPTVAPVAALLQVLAFERIGREQLAKSAPTAPAAPEKTSDKE